MTTLVMAGEAVFVLPFVLPRVFRPTVLDALAIDNTQLGAAFSLYGTVAMASYFFGGPLADRFPTRWMMTLALVSTAGAGLYYATLPGATGLLGLYGVWGATTILLFWAGLLRATREWGGQAEEGRAYGVLDGGRGLCAALLSTAAVALFAWRLPDAETATLAERRAALRTVILAASAFTALTGALLLAVLPASRGEGRNGPRWTVRALIDLAKRPALWLQAVIVVCAYVGYKGTDDLSLLVKDVLAYDDVQAASVGTLAFWVRPVAAVAAGFAADWFGGWRTVAVSFGLLVVADLLVVAGVVSVSVGALTLAVLGACVAVYALRGVYFALFRDAAVPVAYTGTAVGIVSVVGYTPDVFFGPLMGWVLDRRPGAAGHADLFLLLAGFAVVGLLATLGFAAATAAERAPSSR
jgi:MFS family permease